MSSVHTHDDADAGSCAGSARRSSRRKCHSGTHSLQRTTTHTYREGAEAPRPRAAPRRFSISARPRALRYQLGCGDAASGRRRSLATPNGGRGGFSPPRPGGAGPPARVRSWGREGSVPQSAPLMTARVTSLKLAPGLACAWGHILTPYGVHHGVAGAAAGLGRIVLGDVEEAQYALQAACRVDDDDPGLVARSHDVPGARQIVLGMAGHDLEAHDVADGLIELQATRDDANCPRRDRATARRVESAPPRGRGASRWQPARARPNGASGALGRALKAARRRPSRARPS